MTNTRNDERDNGRDLEQPDGDARLTAYALGELEGEERRQVEALIARDPAARAEVEAIRASAAELEVAFAAEAHAAPPALTAAQKASIESAARAAPAPVLTRRYTVLRWMPSLAAAALLVAYVVWDNRAELTSAPRVLEQPVALGGQDARGRVEQADELVHSKAVDRLGQLGYRGNSPAPARSELGELPQLEAPQAPADAVVSEAVVSETLAASEVVQANEQLSLDALQALGYSPASGSARSSVAGRPAPAAPPPFATGGTKVAHRAARKVGAGAAATNAPGAADAEVLRESVVAAEHVHDDAPRLRYFVTPPRAQGSESYQPIVEQGFQSPWTAPLSTFGVDVDTASYSNVRRFLNNGQLPPADAVRLEELVNYFRYADPPPAADAPEGCPFSVTVQTAPAPWAPQHRLVRVGLKGREVPAAERPQSNLVFLLDVSGSMSDGDKLPLLKECLKLMTRQLDERDRVAIAVYAGAAGLVLEPTTCDVAGREKVLEALERLQAGGSTAGAAGIQLAYQTATKHFRAGGTNRVLLATDGDFNVGITDRDQLQRLIEDSARSGVFLTVLGFGEGNLKDGTAELLADKGNGVYAYVDSLDEGRRVLVQQMGGTLVTIAKDVKLQVEFNPAQVGAYRLLGYENRALAAQDFNDDRKDAGDIGAGHGVTALYEIVPAGVGGVPGVDALKYQDAPAPAVAKPELVDSDELLNVKLRWKAPDAQESRKIEVPVRDAGGSLAQAPADLRFAAAVAGYAMKLRGSDHGRDLPWDVIVALADGARGSDPDGWRAEFVRLARIARDLQGGEQPLDEATRKFLEQIGYSEGDNGDR